MPNKSPNTCAHCRQVKQKCTGEKPTCSRCEKREIQCIYPQNHPTPPPTSENQPRRPSHQGQHPLQGTDNGNLEPTRGSQQTTQSTSIQPAPLPQLYQTHPQIPKFESHPSQNVNIATREHTSSFKPGAFPPPPHPPQPTQSQPQTNYPQIDNLIPDNAFSDLTSIRPSHTRNLTYNPRSASNPYARTYIPPRQPSPPIDPRLLANAPNPTTTLSLPANTFEMTSNATLLQELTTSTLNLVRMGRDESPLDPSGIIRQGIHRVLGEVRGLRNRMYADGDADEATMAMLDRLEDLLVLRHRLCVDMEGFFVKYGNLDRVVRGGRGEGQ